ncbi:MAG: cupin domain-containing protein, partial [Candidatus Dormibacter sp.]
MTNGSADTLGHLSTPVVSLDWKEQLRSLRASDSYRGADQASRTLARHPTFRVVLVALKAHGRVDEHHPDSVVSVHCLDGQIRFEVAGAAYELTPGQLLVVTERLPHSVVALAESAFLLIIGKPHHDERADANERESGMTGGSDGLNQVVARADSVPLHSVQGLVVEDTPICLIRADDGRFYALRDNCTH